MTPRPFLGGRLRRLTFSVTASLLLGCGTANAAGPATGSEVASVAATRVLAVGSLTAKAKPGALGAVLDQEVRATLELYLSGKIDTWYEKTDHSGVVFILNLTTMAEAHAMLERLPLGQAGLMTFELTPIGPLQPLGLLLKQPASSLAKEP